MSGRYWARTSDPQLVEMVQAFAPVRASSPTPLRSAKSLPRPNAGANPNERQTLPSLPREMAPDEAVTAATQAVRLEYRHRQPGLPPRSGQKLWRKHGRAHERTALRAQARVTPASSGSVVAQRPVGGARPPQFVSERRASHSCSRGACGRSAARSRGSARSRRLSCRSRLSRGSRARGA